MAWQQRVRQEDSRVKRFNERIHENDGSVWKDRNIDMSIKNTNNNFWQSVNADTFKHSIAELNPRVKYTPYTRMNNGNVPVRDGFISNGTAVNMCDPSSMRD
jgi:hypothetical protein